MIPLNKSLPVGRELKYLKEVLASGSLSGDGPFTFKCESFIQKLTGAKKVLLTPSCTDALELAFLLLDIKPGDEVILPSFTFASTANAFVLRGARPRFVDIREDTLNMDENELSKSVSSKTSAICPIHYGGIPSEMTKIINFARMRRIPVVEDAAQALGAEFNSKAAGTWGTFGAISFHDTKNITCGEGGALLINDPQFITRAEIIRQKGTNRTQFIKGKIDKYSWVDVGSSFVPSELQAAFLLGQLENYSKIVHHREKLFVRYQKSFSIYERRGRIRLPVIPKKIRSSFHVFYMILENKAERDRMIKALRDQGVGAAFHYVPLHLSLMGEKYGYKYGDFPVCEDISERLIRLPLYNSMTLEDQNHVIASVKKAL